MVLLVWLAFGQLSARGGYIVYDLASKQAVAEQAQGQSLNIASNLKLFTSLVALQELGSDFRFATQFRWKQDTLFVKAGGDPTLVMEELYLIGLELKKSGAKTALTKCKEQLKSKEVTVVIDDQLYFPSGYQDLPNAKNDRAYNAPVSALALNYNTYRLDIVKGKVSVKTPGGYFVVKPREELGEQILTRAYQDKLLIEVGKKMSKRRRRKFKRVYNPTSHFFYTLCYYLDLPETTQLVRRKLSDEVFADGDVYTHHSKPLKDILHLMNIYSSNFIAESLGCYLGQHKFGDAKMGVRMVESFIQDSLGQSARLESCSGMGKNYLSVQTILELLKYVWSKPFLRLDFFAGLPDLGKEGTLERIDSQMKVKAKSGSLYNVSALSGLYQGKQQRLYLFAFVENGSYAKAVRSRDQFLKNVLGKF